MLKDNELQKYYEECLNTMASPGWTYILEDLQKIRASVNEIGRLKDEHGLYFAKGQLDVLDHVLALREKMRFAFETLQEQEDDDASDLRARLS